MEHLSSFSSRVRASASALTTDCFSNVSPSTTTSALASGLENNGKTFSESTLGDGSSSASSSLPGAREHMKGVHFTGEHGFRTRSSDSIHCEGTQQRAFECFKSDQGRTESGSTSDSTKLINEVKDQTSPKESSWFTKSKEVQELNGSVKTDVAWPLDESDGAAVVSLLSSPDFVVQGVEHEGLDEELELEDNRYETTKTNSTADISHRRPATLHTRHLIPKFNEKNLDKPNLALPQWTLPDTNLGATTETYHLIPIEPSPCVFTRPWVELGNSYQEQVWGDQFSVGDGIHSGTGSIQAAAHVYHRQPVRERLDMIRRHLQLPILR